MIHNIRVFRVVAALLIATITFACNKEKQEEVVKLRPVRTIELSSSEFEKQGSYTGVVKSDKEINLSFRTSGILTLLNIHNGMQVKKGDLLARIDNAESQLSLEQAAASLYSAEINLNTATSTLNRIRTLYEKGSASLSDYENVRASYASTKANYESSKRSVDIQKKQVSYGVIYAPEKGTIAERKVENNENVSAGQVIATLNAGSTMQVHLGLPEGAINMVRVGDTVDVKMSSLAENMLSGVVSEVSLALDQQSSTYPIRVDIINNGDKIRSGMVATVIFSYDNGNKSSAIIVPAGAVGEDSKGNFLFVVSRDKGDAYVVKRRSIKVGDLTPNGFMITSGVQKGERVAVAGLQTLLDGQKVILSTK